MKHVLYILFGLICFESIAQMDSLKLVTKANEHFDNYSYGLALKVYEKVESEDIDILRNMAISAWKTDQLPTAERKYSEVIEMDGATAKDFMNYYQILREVQAYEISEKIMQRYGKMKPKDNRYILFSKKKGSWKDLMKPDTSFRLKHLNMNSGHQDFGATYYGDKIVYVTTKEPFKPIRRRYNVNQLPYLDLYVATVYDTNFVNVQPFDNKINSKFHEGSAAFNASNDLMFFSKNVKRNIGDGKQYFHLFYAKKEGDDWQKPIQLPFDTAAWSSGHPTISGDGKWLYFSSSMPGGEGGADLWKVEIKGEGEFGEPINLGDKINTEGNETYPYIHPENELFFFSSDGRYGLGGLDVYQTTISGDGFGEISNMGTPINSSRDDFAFIVSKDKKSGYLSSNRNGNKGSDDIYFVVIKKNLENK